MFFSFSSGTQFPNKSLATLVDIGWKSLEHGILESCSDRNCLLPANMIILSQKISIGHDTVFVVRRGWWARQLGQEPNDMATYSKKTK